MSVPAKPCIGSVENSIYKSVSHLQSADVCGHCEWRIEGEQHRRHTNVTTPSISPYEFSRDGVAAVPYTYSWGSAPAAVIVGKILGYLLKRSEDRYDRTIIALLINHFLIPICYTSIGTFVATYYMLLRIEIRGNKHNDAF